MSRRRLLRNQRGVTLIDLIVIIVIVAIALPPMIGLLIQVTRQSTFGVTVTRANHLASTLFEEIRSKRGDETAGAPSTTLGPEFGETRASYDDVDDYHGLDESPPKDSLGTDGYGPVPPVPETVMVLAAASGVSEPSRGVPRALNFRVLPAKL